jgi:heat shock protein HtpX
MKRIVLFLATNFAVVLLLSITAQVLGLNRWLTANGLNLGGLLAFCALFGFGGAFISLAMSKFMAKRAMGVQVIDTPRDATERWVVDTVRRQAEQAGIAMPEVGVFDSPEVNAFATGMSRNSSLVAVSTGLLRGMSRNEAEAVLAHEVSHAANGDMVTLTLIQGVVNTFVMFLARVIGYAVDKVILKNERGHGIGFFAATFVAEIVLGLLASIIVMWFSRLREYRADAGGAALAGRENMIAALQRLKATYEQPTAMPDGMKAFGISSGGGMLGGLLRTHPSLDDRIEALRAAGTANPGLVR